VHLFCEVRFSNHYWTTGGMQASEVFDSTVKTSATGLEIEKLLTPPDSARSFYSATAPIGTTSGQHTARTMFFTPESSPESAASVTSRQSSEFENDGCLQQDREAFPSPTRFPTTTSVDSEDLLVSASECTLQSLALDASKKAIHTSSNHFDGTHATYSTQFGNFRDVERSQSLRTTDKIPAQHTASRDDVHVFRADVMSEAYEVISSLDSPRATSSDFCFAVPDRESKTVATVERSVAHFYERGDLCRDSVDEFAAIIEVPSSISNGRSALPDAMPLPTSSPLHEVPSLAAMEPPVSTAPPIHIVSTGPFAFTTADEAKEIIPRLSSMLTQLQNIHGECSLDVLLTCTRLASAHHFIKDLAEAKRLYTKCLHVSARYAQLCLHLRIFYV
jgi:hypothetical protein